VGTVARLVAIANAVQACRLVLVFRAYHANINHAMENVSVVDCTTTSIRIIIIRIPIIIHILATNAIATAAVAFNY